VIDDQDHYEAYYADKLWGLLPAVYRAGDSDSLDAKGPLRELVERIGAQAAVLRRSIDRLWEDQSIETCDDWVIPYLGELLATNLVAHLDARGQRVDVAKTIYYRRRKGTLAVLEEIAANITGWDARVVEFFRRLGRTRHGLDPALGQPNTTPDDARKLQLAEGLVGPLTSTWIGGLADLRNAYGASRAGTAFDEFFHTADFRRGQGQVGWYDIPRLGVFLWRLQSFGAGPCTPVAVKNCDGWFTFDPTGRDVPLFAAAARDANSYGDNWVSPVEAQLPAPVSQPLFDAQYPPGPPHPSGSITGATNASPIVVASTAHGLVTGNQVTVTGVGGNTAANGTFSVTRVDADHFSLDGSAGNGAYTSGGTWKVVPPPTPAFPLYPGSLAVYPITAPTRDDQPLPPTALKVRPPRGRFQVVTGSTATLSAKYHYGFSSAIGAGPYDRRQGRTAPAALGTEVKHSGGGGLGTLPSSGVVTITDSLTYTGVNDVTVQGQLTVRADIERCPVLRRQTTPGGWTQWTITGAGQGPNCLVLDGLLLSGADVVLAGAFDCVTVTCCTLDPGTDGANLKPKALFAGAADGQDLVPCRLWVEGTVGTLTVERSILGPVRTRGGQVETLTVTDSILQAIPTAPDSNPIQARDVKDPAGLLKRLRSTDPVAVYLLGKSAALKGAVGTPPAPLPALQPVLDALNALLVGPSLYDPTAFKGVPLSAATVQLRDQATNPATPPPGLNRRLVEDAFPLELADAALAFADGDVDLTRCSILGRAVVHRLRASGCILRDLVQVDDAQHGCVRFSAWADGSVLPRQYESVRVSQGAALFVSTEFGQPTYCQLLPTADAAILSPAGAATISGGAADGSEMGAFAREKNPVKERGLLIKFQEFLPAGLVPVLVYAT
jgi:hypothetical protein